MYTAEDNSAHDTLHMTMPGSDTEGLVSIVYRWSTIASPMESTVYKKRDTSVPRKHQAYYRDRGRGPCMVQWLKLPAWKVADGGVEPHSGLLVSKKQNVFSPLTRKNSRLWENSVPER